MPDLDGICVRKEIVGGRLVLVPSDERASEFISKLTDKKDVLVTIRSPRSPDHHKFFFKYLSRVIENTDNIWSDVEELLEAVKFATGHTTRFRRITNPHAQDLALANEITAVTLYMRKDEDGVYVYEPFPIAKTTKVVMALRRGADEYITKTKSINFASMGEEKFKAFHAKAVEALNTFLGWDTTTLMEKKNDPS